MKIAGGGRSPRMHAGAAMPNLTYDALDVVPEGLKDYAKKDEASGKFVVEVVPGVKLAEFRDNNIAISKQRDELAATVGKLKPHIGDDLDAFITTLGELNQTAQGVKDGKLKSTADIEAEVLRRVESMKTGFENQIKELGLRAATAEQTAGVADQKFKRSIVDRAVTQAVVDASSGALPTALDDILTRAYRVFKVADEGKITAMDGEAVIYGADGVSPMTPLEWMGKLREQAPHFFKNSNGGGASGGTVAGSFGGKSPEEMAKMSPMQRLQLANETAAKAAVASRK